MSVMYTCMSVMYTCMSVMYTCMSVMDIDLASVFYDVWIGFWNCSDSVVFFVFHFLFFY